MRALHYSFFLVLIILSISSCKSSTGSSGDDDVNGFNETGFFKTDGQQILNRQGEPVVIKGFGLGGWLLPEGYMFRITHPAGEGATEIFNQVADLIGESGAEEWTQLFRDNYVTEQDIEEMKAWGVDHVRIPFHYNLFYDIEAGGFIDEGFERIDELLVWCKRHRVDVILDMHAAPGAQSDGAIADSDGEARFWTESETYWPIAIEIWEKIARRYKDENIIIGYDIINEPVTPAPYDGRDLARFYGQAVTAIRAIDQNHILFIEGNYFATTFDYLYPPFDDNMVYAFHKYWNETDQGTIQYLLNIREQYDVPLWLGETGENSNGWFYETVQLVEGLNIGWNWWTHKKLETITSPLSSPTNDNYDKVVAYWKDEGPRPTEAEARDGLFEMAEGLKIENNTFRPDVIASLFSPSFGTEGVPYTELNIPGNIEMVNYDIGMNGISYFDNAYKRVSGDEIQSTGNQGWEYRNDGVDIQSSDDLATDYNIGWIDTGEWMEYTVNVTATGTYDIVARVSSPGNTGRFRLKLNNQIIGSEVSVQNTGGNQSWQQLQVGSYEFEEGTHTLRFEVTSGGFNISLLTIN
ncbi:MAG: carbohydrate-binding protein [Balneola sp.]|nr:MAG: carbohydrate-binding protein [Balneola sp.]